MRERSAAVTAKVCVVEVDVVKDAADVIRDWCKLVDADESFVEDWEVDDGGGISALFDGERDYLPFKYLKMEMTSGFCCYEMRYTDLEYLGGGKYRCRFHKDVESEGIVVELDGKTKGE